VTICNNWWCTIDSSLITRHDGLADVDVDVVELRAQADASMPTSNNNVNSHYIH